MTEGWQIKQAFDSILKRTKSIKPMLSQSHMNPTPTAGRMAGSRGHFQPPQTNAGKEISNRVIGSLSIGLYPVSIAASIGTRPALSSSINAQDQRRLGAAAWENGAWQNRPI
jgi:hypothetical protein